MKNKCESPTGVQELCRRLKDQLDELANTFAPELLDEEEGRRTELMEKLKSQLDELSQ